MIRHSSTHRRILPCIMTKRLLILLFALSALPAFAQAKRYYCEIKGIENGFSAGLKIIFDLGDDPTYNISGSLSSKQELVDGNGEKIRFNSMVDAANYMVDKGWTFQQAYSSSYGGHPIIHWIFYKEAESPEKVREGIMTREEYRRSMKQAR